MSHMDRRDISYRRYPQSFRTSTPRKCSRGGTLPLPANVRTADANPSESPNSEKYCQIVLVTTDKKVK